jgi:hypothetical protein
MDDPRDVAYLLRNWLVHFCVLKGESRNWT